MAIIWIPISECAPPTQVWCHVRTTEWRITAGYCIAQLSDNGYWWSSEYGYISGVTHWSRVEG